MRRRATRISQWTLILAAPLTVAATSTGPPIARTGAAVDGGLNCTACHRTYAVNSGAGKFIINAAPYTPGVKQVITLINTDPAGQRWGFQLTARLKSDETKQAGTFSTSDFVRVRCDPDGRDAPCGGAKEFAEHTSAGTRPGAPPPGVFQVEWTPPSEDVGEVIFYAAGNAANNSSTNAGDRIYTTSFAIPSTICTLTGRPSITSVKSATGGSVISTNSLIAISGGSFVPGGSYPVTAGDLREGKLPGDQFRCVSVEVNGSRAPLVYVGRDLIHAQAPILEMDGTVDVRVIANPGSPQEIRSDAAKTQVAVYAPSFFTFDGKNIVAFNDSKGHALVGAFSVFPSAAPAQPGDTVSLYGTGFGVLEPVYQPGEFAPEPTPLRDPVTVTIGGMTLQQTDVVYAGASGEMPGLIVFKVKLPASLPDGDTPVVIRIGSAQTQSGAVIAVKK